MQTSAFLKMFKIFSSVIFLSLFWIGESNGDFGYPDYPCIYPCRCDERPIDPVCAVNYRTFKNLCFLDLYNRNLAQRGVYLRRLYHGPCFEPGHPNYETQYDRPPYEEPFEDEFFDAPYYDDPNDFVYDPSPDNTYVGQPYDVDPAYSYVNPNFNADPQNPALPSYSSSYGAVPPPPNNIPAMPNNNISSPVSTLPPATIAPTTIPIATLAPTTIAIATLAPTMLPPTTLPPIPPPTTTVQAPPAQPRQDTVIIPRNVTVATTLPPTTAIATEVLPVATNATEAPVNATTIPLIVTTSIPVNETTTIRVVVETTTLVPNVTSSTLASANRTPAVPVYPHRQYGPIQA